MAAILLCLLSGVARAHVLDVWRTRSSGVNANLWAAAWGNGTWVVVGDQGTILTSPDGLEWTPQVSGTIATLNSMVFAAGLFVAVGDQGTIVTSDNGVDWTLRNSGTGEFIYDVNYGQGKFIGVGASQVLTSTDGATWEGLAEGSRSWYGVNYGNGNFVAVGGYTFCIFANCKDRTLLSFSADGLTWNSGGLDAGRYLSDLAFGNGLFVASGDAGTILTSSNGAAWTPAVSGANAFLYNVAFGDGMFVAVGDPVTLITSADGVTWTRRNPGTGVGLCNAAYGNNTFIVVGYGGTILQSRYFGAPKLSNPRLLPNGSIEIRVVGKVDQRYRFAATTDFSAPNWTTIRDYTQTGEAQTLVEPNAASSASRFYRVSTLP